MYRLLLIKRCIEDILISPFILLGRAIAILKPLKNKYRIFFFFPFYHTGGAEKVHAQIAQATGGSDCIIFFTKKSVDERFLDEFKKSGCVIKDISKNTDNKFFYAWNLMYRGIITGYINSQKNKPVVFNGQCNFGYKISPWIKKSIKQIELIHSLNTFSYIRIPFLPFINRTIMISKKRIEDHKELYRKYKIPESYLSRVTYIANAINLPVSYSGKNKIEFKVLNVGRSTPDKRVGLFIKIAEKLQRENKNIQFEIIGDVTSAIASIDYPYIKFHGSLSDENKINSIYSSAQVLLLTSSSEGFPLVIMEAMANGCAILATPVGDIPFHVKNDVNGFLFSSVEKEEIIINEAKEKIYLLNNHYDQFDKISANNISYANHNFGIERFNKDYQQLFESIK